MQVVHEVQGMKTGQHIELIKKDRGNGASALCPAWGVSINLGTGNGVVILSSTLTAAANLFLVLEQAVKSGEIIGILEG
jgi:hypothetical protein